MSGRRPHRPPLGFGVTKQQLYRNTPYFLNHRRLCRCGKLYNLERKIKMSEIVYIFSNPAMPGYIKIGRTSRDDVKPRLKELSDLTGIPMPFVCIYAAEVADAKKVEDAIHTAFAVDRPNPRREFFTTSPERIIALLKAHAISDKTPLAQEVLAEITSPEDKAAQARATSAFALRNSWWTFNEIGITPGEELEFVPDPAIKCKVTDGEQSVEYQGKKYPSLPALAKALGHWDEKDPSAPMLFRYKGELLSELRKK